MQKKPNNSGKFITLKEAAKISGYAPDYLGQLIRKGKLKGKRVFLNEAWVTTEEDVRTYLASDGKNKHYSATAFFETNKFKQTIRIVLYVCLALSMLLVLFLFYAFSSILDNTLQQNALRAVETSEARPNGANTVSSTLP
jgi:hypothetical protein